MLMWGEHTGGKRYQELKSGTCTCQAATCAAAELYPWPQDVKFLSYSTAINFFNKSKVPFLTVFLSYRFGVPLEARSHFVFQTILEFTVQPAEYSNSMVICTGFLSAVITHMYHHTWLQFSFCA